MKQWGVKKKKLVFPYDWLDSYEKLDHVGKVEKEEFHSKLKGKGITDEEYANFLKEFVQEDV